VILCCGEALIDMLPRPGAEGETLLPVPGGAVFNTAVALGRLGAQAGYFGGLSTDLFGARLDAALTAAGVDTALAPRSDRPTTLAFVRLVEGHADYTFYDENTAGRMLAPEALPALPAAVRALFFGGISLVSEPAADSYAALCARTAQGTERRLVMIDPNIRPAFITAPARYRARLTDMLARADVVKVSDEDLAWLTGGQDPRALMTEASGPAVVIVTRGAEGATAHLADRTLTVPARPAEVVDTVGAGDTFNAGFLAELQARDALDRARLTPEVLEAALTLAARTAAVTVSRAGANPPWRAELA
jgi:fructokinase